jgi:magnesium chelatase family protein
MSSFARSVGAAVWGVEARLVDVQVFVPGQGETGVFRIVGLGDGAVREGRERIRGAVLHAGYPWPQGSVTVNLAPASARKEGPALDLPTALALLEAIGSLGQPQRLSRTLCVGELSLDGRVRAVRGALACAEAARRHGIEEALVPAANALEAAAVGGLCVRGVETLAQAVGHLRGTARVPPVPAASFAPVPAAGPGLAHVRGQGAAVRAAVLAAVGGHNLLLTGAPGAGKTLLARALRDLLPPLTVEEAKEVSRVHSAAGLLDGAPPERGGLVASRPFRAPHHTTSLPGLLGGGPVPRPGEVSLAHLGVLFLDELAEYPRPTLEALRQPIEDGEIVLGRAAGRARFPSDVVLVGAMNPCPCGWRGSGVRPCRCPEALAARYRHRISGPLLDRFDLRIEVRPVDPTALLAEDGDARVPAAAAIEEARERQAERARRLGYPRPVNARIPPPALRAAVRALPAATERVLRAARRFGLSARGVHRTLRVARTAADLAGRDDVALEDVDEALQYRGEDG